MHSQSRCILPSDAISNALPLPCSVAASVYPIKISTLCVPRDTQKIRTPLRCVSVARLDRRGCCSYATVASGDLDYRADLPLIRRCSRHPTRTPAVRIRPHLAMVATSTLFFASLLAFASAKSTLVLHEQTDIPEGYIVTGKAHPSTKLNLRIGLAARDFVGLEQALSDVSTPSSRSYGQHLSKDEVSCFRIVR
jgi:hypothetical protein